MHSRTGCRRNSGRREPVESATEMINNETADGQKCHRRWCNGELRASPAVSRGTGQVNPSRMQDRIEGYKGCPPTSEISLEIESNFNTRQMII